MVPDPLAELSLALQDELADVDRLIRSSAESELVERIGQIAEHLFAAGGKRVRPMLTLAMGRLHGCVGTSHLNLAAALEFIHTTTLLHDDVVDKSSRRRGRPTANLLWDNKSSILVGDYFFARAFQLMVTTKSIDALVILSDTSAIISEAEVLQMARMHGIDLDEATYFKIIEGKTAVLFSAAAKLGALVAGSSEKQGDAAGRFGQALGMSYQIRDDVLDYEGTGAALGKNVGDDFRDRKTTLPVVRALEHASDKERMFWRRVFEKGDQRDGDLEHALEIMHSRGILEQVQEEAVRWSTVACNELEEQPMHPIRDTLARVAEFAANRNK